jgi:hypothetical protein
LLCRAAGKEDGHGFTSDIVVDVVLGAACERSGAWCERRQSISNGRDREEKGREKHRERSEKVKTKVLANRELEN